MPSYSHFILSLFLVTASIVAKGQTYFTNGDARSLVGGCFQLTSATDWQLSSVWYADRLDLKKDFDLEFELNFGTKDDGADGIVFVLQTRGNNAIGASGGGIGFEGFSPSLGVEFDDWNNINYGDLASDHIAILKNGSVDHNGANSIAAPVPALPNSGNIEDGKNHLVRITWEVSTNILEVWFDCEKRQSIELDIVTEIFGGESEVFWGFTASTGGSNNLQIACLRNDILVSDTFYLCDGEPIELNTRESDDNTYMWSPNTFLSDNTIQNPICDATRSLDYTIEYTDKCGDILQDTIHVAVQATPNLETLADIELCKDELVTLRIENFNGTVFWNNEAGDESYDILNYEGGLNVKSVNNCGVDSIELQVEIIECTCDIWIPNIVTPDNDGINDDFGAVGECPRLRNYSLSIFNRWGEKLFETSNYEELWDVTFNNNEVVGGVYFYVATWTSGVNEEEDTVLTKGTVHVIR